ncbi:MAG TPA: alpha-xylosidase [Porphyromonadaceae bacterium]|jgi:alpha-D-xyloside xylohydrolase|nr:alpha-xylosidase [Porphyromonadaceae bacterium]HBX18887.1 alpha-xylosidase [Porphyromonadaceae bacterium]HCM21158.1 alpha-xylosidase [Porphyromonadaceae bacterium]
MQKRFYLFIVIIGLLSLLLSCSSTSYKKKQNGIIVSIKSSNKNNTHKIRLQAINDRIIHVSATPENDFSSEQSLIITPDLTVSHPFEVSEDINNVIFSTKELDVKINKETGQVCFFDKNGLAILQEKEEDGKSFTPIEVEGTKGYTLHQVFESPEDEAFYGLGQHQSDEFNHKGKNESLFQYNTKVSVPFVVSNKNYGILWDNYSFSKFGDIRDYEQLSQFRLFDKHGQEGALTALYENKNSKQAIERKETIIDYENLELIKNFPEGFSLDGANVIWEGDIEASESGLYHFILRYAGYTTIFLDNQRVVKQRWRTAWNPNDYKFSVNLTAGKRTPIRIEWEPDGSTSYLSLKALSPLPEKEQNSLSLWSEMGNEIDYYFIYGNNLDDVISGYRTITGKAQIMPKWAMGFWQSRERYKTQGELLETLAEFRKRHIPIDNIVQDWFYWPVEDWGDHDFDSLRFPNPKAMVDSIHRMNAKIMLSVWPKFYATTEHYKQFDQNGWIYRQAIKDSIRDWVYPGYIGSFYDAYAEGARKLFWKQMEEKLYPLGFDAWWMDASEPNIQDNTSLEYRKALCGPTALGPSTKYFNAYALMNAQAIYEGQRGVDPNKRVFLLTRSGFAGVQRYSTAVWSGDIGTRWEDLKAQISAGLNFALSGIPYWTMDIGGFCVEKRYENAQRLFDATGIENEDLKEWRELNTRWYQFGAFVPLFRAHGQFPYREIFNIAPENHPAYQSILYYIKLRYRLMPYIYSLAGMTNLEDYTIMRALIMDFPKNERVTDISNQYMFGPALMVCPIYEYKARSREVYFPHCSGWYDLYTGKFIEGNQTKNIHSPYERMPLFVKGGSIIPYGPEIEYTDEKKSERITLYVYAGEDGSFSLYEDEGTNYEYEKSNYSIIPLTYHDSTKTLVIGERRGNGFKSLLKNRVFNIVYVNPENPKAFNPEMSGTEIQYEGTEISVKLS